MKKYYFKRINNKTGKEAFFYKPFRSAFAADRYAMRIFVNQRSPYTVVFMTGDEI